MRSSDLLNLVTLAAIWGLAFIFMRVAAPEFGPVGLVFIRLLIAAACLLPLLLNQQRRRECKEYWSEISVVAIFNTALPFCLFAYATLELAGGFTSVINATAPLWATLVALIWLRQTIDWQAWLGLALGFIGVVILVDGKLPIEKILTFSNTANGIFAAVLASVCYGFSANYSKKKLHKVSSKSIAAASQLAAVLLITPLGVIYWPEQSISNLSWLAAVALGLICTAWAYLLYFKLIENLGPSKAISVTFLIPVFGIFWGWLLIGESIANSMLLGCSVILVGVALTMGYFKTNKKHSNDP